MSTCYVIELETQVARFKGQSYFWTDIERDSFSLENWKAKTFETREAAEATLALLEDKYRSKATGAVRIMGPKPSVLKVGEYSSDVVDAAKASETRFDYGYPA